VSETYELGLGLVLGQSEDLETCSRDLIVEVALHIRLPISITSRMGPKGGDARIHKPDSCIQECWPWGRRR
jgi:hypothetical protein